MQQSNEKLNPKVVVKEGQPPCKVYAAGGQFFGDKDAILVRIAKPLPHEDRRAYQIRMMRGMCGEVSR